MIKWILTASAITLMTTAAQAQYRGYGTGSNSQSHSVGGHTTNRGTYVQPHTSTNPNSTQTDNYGSRGNYNPNNGTYGTKTPKY